MVTQTSTQPTQPAKGSAADQQPTTSLGFDTLPLSPALLANLGQLGYRQMTEIQAASLPITLAGGDLIAQAKTGSGKTAAFALTLLAKLDTRRFELQGLVLCPTRELAEQVAQELRRLARAEDNIKVITLVGGTALRNQANSLAHGAHIAVGTPGRVIDHLTKGTLNLTQLQILVLDEADRMLDMGFVDEIAHVVRATPPTRQTLLFSATYPDGIAKLATQFMRTPHQVKVTAQHADSIIRQRFYEVRETERLRGVSAVLNHYRPASALAFCNTKQQVRALLDHLIADGFSVLALHGELEQRDRDQVMVQFANRSCTVLVATDLAARGLDVAQLEMVINVEVTYEPEVHIHRIGRTGRTERSGSDGVAADQALGWAISLVSPNERGRLAKIELAQNLVPDWHTISSLKPASAAPLQAPMVTLQILGGRKEKIRPGDVLGALTGEMGLTNADVGKINVNDFSTYVAVRREVWRQALRQLNAGKIKGKSVKARLVDADE